MKVGTIREVKPGEFRVGLTPTSAAALTAADHEVIVEAGAGVDAGYTDVAYEVAGATIVPAADDVAADVDMLVKVKELLPEEFRWLRPGLLLLGYLHLAPEPEMTQALLNAGVTAIAYEAVRLEDGGMPLLRPMSEVAGRMAGEIAAQYLKRPPGRGKLLGGIEGIAPARAVVLGSGTVGVAATSALVALGAEVVVIARERGKLAVVQGRFPERVRTRVSSADAIASELRDADVLIGGLRVPGGVAPKLVTREIVRSMGEGAVIVDVCIDQGGISETSRLTTHADPIYVDEGVVHYCVSNMPGAVPRTSTEALTAATLPYVLKLANRGLDAIRDDPALAAGASIVNGKLTDEDISRTQGRAFTPLTEALGS